MMNEEKDLPSMAHELPTPASPEAGTKAPDTPPVPPSQEPSDAGQQGVSGNTEETSFGPDRSVPAKDDSAESSRPDEASRFEACEEPAVGPSSNDNAVGGQDLHSLRQELYPSPDAVVGKDSESGEDVSQEHYHEADSGAGDAEERFLFDDGSDDEASGAPPSAPAELPAEEIRRPETKGPAYPQRHQGRGRRRGRGGRQESGRPERSERREEHSSGSAERGHGREHRGVPKHVQREILANTSFEETRIAIVENGKLAELHWERKSSQNIVGNIYKGVVENVLPGISSAFVNIGFEKNAYLYISDVLGERGANIDATLKKGQHIMIQVAKEAIGTKGMKVTMDVSLPGRYLVFTPFQNYVGISKHIGNPQERVRLSEIVDGLVAKYLSGKGVVVRTEAEGASAADLEREVKYLGQLWSQIQKKFQTQAPPALLHKDLDLTLQVARDILSDKIYCYLLDNKENFKNVQEFIEAISPELKDRVRYYDAKTPIFKAFNLENDIENLRRIKVPLPNGGSIVIQEAESLCAIDVNTGRFTGNKSQEETVTQTNIEAAHEIAYQLRLRNIGGIIVVDFIDMRKASNRQKVMEAFSHAVKSDRAKIRILPITRLGLIEMTRERKRESTVSLITEECPQCKGAGRVLSGETLRIRIQREIGVMTGGRPGGQVRLLLHPALAEQFRAKQAFIEKHIHRSIKIQSDPQLSWEDYRIVLE